MIAKLEAGTRDCSRETARRLREALGVAASELRPPEPAEPEPGEVIGARAAVLIARDKRDAIRTLVGERKIGASELHIAEYRLALALRRWDAALVD